jgi:four helix bundle protein
VAEINSCRDLEVWQQAMELAVSAYHVTRNYPSDERYGLIAQIRRAARSVPTNIAEGYGRDRTGSYIQFLKNARGSLKELESHLLLTERVGVSESESLGPLLKQSDKIGRMLNA